eukprot:11940023-Karenia_brevis.AAC.1
MRSEVLRMTPATSTRSSKRIINPWLFARSPQRGRRFAKCAAWGRCHSPCNTWIHCAVTVCGGECPP